MRKKAFIAALGGAAAGTAGAAGRGLWRAAQNSPGNVAGAAFMAPFAVPSMLAADPAAKALAQRASTKRRYLAAAAGGTMKAGSVQYDREEVVRAVAIRRSLEKTSAWKPPKKLEEAIMFAPAALAAGLGLGAAGAATMGASYAVGKGTEAGRSLFREKRYRKMLKADPSLRQSPKSRAFFNVLDRASPYIAGEPQVAAATVRSMIAAPEGYALHPKYMKDILGVEESRQKTRFPALRAPVFKGELPDMGG